MPIIVSRHGESVASARKIANGDPARDAGLTEKGREEARELGRLVAGDPIELCVTSLFPRTRETGEIALAGGHIPFITIAALNDIRYGWYEGRPMEEYRAWSTNHGMSVRTPDGGESDIDVARRLCDAFGDVLSRSERCILVVTHELLVGYLRMAIGGEDPASDHPDIPYATPYRHTAAEVTRGIERIRVWLDRMPAES